MTLAQHPHVQYAIVAGSAIEPCASCGEHVAIFVTPAGRRVPVNIPVTPWSVRNGMTVDVPFTGPSHLDLCPRSATARRRAR